MLQQHETRDPWIEPIAEIAKMCRPLSTWEFMELFFGSGELHVLSNKEAARRIENILFGLGLIPTEPNKKTCAPYLWTRP